jgi:hypothetical protein
MVKLSLYVIKHYAMNTCREVEATLHVILTLALDGSECQLHCPAALLPVKEPQDRSRMGSVSSMDIVENTRSLSPAGN